MAALYEPPPAYIDDPETHHRQAAVGVGDEAEELVADLLGETECVAEGNGHGRREQAEGDDQEMLGERGQMVREHRPTYQVERQTLNEWLNDDMAIAAPKTTPSRRR